MVGDRAKGIDLLIEALETEVSLPVGLRGRRGVIVGHHLVRLFLTAPYFSTALPGRGHQNECRGDRVPTLIQDLA